MRSEFVIVCRFLLFVVLCCSAAPPHAHARVTTEYEVKAAFLINFARFIEWPKDRESEKEFIIGVIGENPFISMSSSMRDQKIGGRPVRIQIFEEGSIGNCDILFITRPWKNSCIAILSQIEGRSTLTVGEFDNFLDHGGMINFVLKNQKIRFEINRAAAEKAGLKINSQLLRLATRVEP